VLTVGVKGTTVELRVLQSELNGWRQDLIRENI